MDRRRWQDHAAFIVGIWLIAAPWALGSFSPDSDNLFKSGVMAETVRAHAGSEPIGEVLHPLPILLSH